MASSEKHPHRWRENIEALVMAIVVALLFKYFVLEISKIPSGSMQPTLMGSPETGVFDRVLVDKVSMRFRDPERFEIVVFKHPIERSRVMVKRLVGMPDEDLKIEHGDLWVRPHGSETSWSILRRPPSVQDEMWLALDGAREGRSSWSVLRGGKGWKISGDDVVADGDGRVRYRADDGPITDRALDGYPPPLLDELKGADGKNPVGDVRVAGAIVPSAELEFLVIELTEGQRAYEFRLPGAAAPADAAAEIRVRDSGSPDASGERVERASGVRLAADRRVRFAAQNLDDRLSLDLDGHTLVTVEIAPNARQETSLTLGVDGGAAEIQDLDVWRDVYYLTPEDTRSWTVAIPPGNYVMLGDNTQDSADSRLWKAKTYGTTDGRKVRGNWREGGENPAFGTLPGGEPALRFRDQWGEVHWFARSALDDRTMPGPSPLVPRDLIVGRAVAIFWPLQPLRRLWRLAWLH